MPIIQNTEDKLILRINISESLANAIRRSVSEIPTLAISEIEVFKNDSALYDEIIGHRLGLLSLKTEKSMSEKTKIDFKLSKTGPGMVYASDLKGPASVVFEKTPITLLNDGAKLELVATAQLGSGLEHAKHAPGLCFYRHLIEVKASGEIEKIIKESKSVFKPEKSGSKYICDLPDAALEKIEKIDKEAITELPELLLTIESFGQMSAKDVLLNAIKVLSKNLDSFEKALK